MDINQFRKSSRTPRQFHGALFQIEPAVLLVTGRSTASRDIGCDVTLKNDARSPLFMMSDADLHFSGKSLIVKILVALCISGLIIEIASVNRRVAGSSPA